MNGQLTVKIKEPTFLDIQQAAQYLISENGLDLGEYWKYAFTNWVISDTDLLNLNAEAGKELSALLPSPQELVDMLGFTKPQATSSTVSSMGDQ
tara:strand:- start:523 stop:804 length:282 start_codon:yes stop_codon:yes gene_type:complete